MHQQLKNLIYAQHCTRPDIAYVIEKLGRYQIKPGIDYWKTAKKIMRYLQRTKDYMFTYRKSDQLQLVGYTDFNYVGCIDKQKVHFKLYFSDCKKMMDLVERSLHSTVTIELQSSTARVKELSKIEAHRYQVSYHQRQSSKPHCVC